jgi:hypothetical protein
MRSTHTNTNTRTSLVIDLLEPFRRPGKGGWFVVTSNKWQTGDYIGGSGIFILPRRSDNFFQRKMVRDERHCVECVVFGNDRVDIVVVSHVVQGIADRPVFVLRRQVSLNQASGITTRWPFSRKQPNFRTAWPGKD